MREIILLTAKSVARLVQHLEERVFAQAWAPGVEAEERSCLEARTDRQEAISPGVGIRVYLPDAGA